MNHSNTIRWGTRIPKRLGCDSLFPQHHQRLGDRRMRRDELPDRPPRLPALGIEPESAAMTAWRVPELLRQWQQKTGDVCRLLIVQHDDLAAVDPLAAGKRDLECRALTLKDTPLMDRVPRKWRWNSCGRSHGRWPRVPLDCFALAARVTSFRARSRRFSMTLPSTALTSRYPSSRAHRLATDTPGDPTRSAGASPACRRSLKTSMVFVSSATRF